MMMCIAENSYYCIHGHSGICMQASQRMETMHIVTISLVELSKTETGEQLKVPRALLGC